MCLDPHLTRALAHRPRRAELHRDPAGLRRPRGRRRPRSVGRPAGRQLVPGRRRQPEADAAIHRLGDTRERRARRARARPERRGQRVQGREQGGRARGSWDLTTEAGGVNPAKDNITRRLGRGSTRRGAGRLPIFRLRARGGGTATFVTFELNRDSRLWNNGNARIPCRRTGDLRSRSSRTATATRRWWSHAGRRPPPTPTPAARLQDAHRRHRPQGRRRRPGHTHRRRHQHLPARRVRVRRSLRAASARRASTLAQGARRRVRRHRPATRRWMHSRSSTAESSNMQDYVARQPIDARTCAAAGTKFFDRNANGQRDDGEPGLPRFEIFAVCDGDGVLDRPRAMDHHRRRRGLRRSTSGRPAASYTLREQLVNPSPRDWRCSCTPARLRPRAVRLRSRADRRRGPGLRARPRLRELVPGAADRADGARTSGRSRPLRPAGEQRGVRPRRR